MTTPTFDPADGRRIEHDTGLGGAESPLAARQAARRDTITTATRPTGHELARKLLEAERDQAGKDIADASDWIRTYTTELAESETRRANAIAALEWLDTLEAGERR